MIKDDSKGHIVLERKKKSNCKAKPIRDYDEEYFILDGKNRTESYYYFQKFPEKVIKLKSQIIVELLDYDYKFNMYRFSINLNNFELDKKEIHLYFNIDLECILLNCTLKALIKSISFYDKDTEENIILCDTYKKIENFLKELNMEEDEQILDLRRFNVPINGLEILEQNETSDNSLYYVYDASIAFSEKFISRLYDYIDKQN